MRLAQELVNHYPRKLIWWMQCDVCQKVGSDPAWSHDGLPLSKFRADGWRCREKQGPLDTCPDCLRKEEDVGLVQSG